MKKNIFLILNVFFFSLLYSVNSDDILGKWRTEHGKSVIEISKENNKYFGKIIWLKEPVYPKGDKNEGKAKKDLKNPDKSKRDTPLIGLKLLWGFKFKNNKWVGGHIYDPESGKTYLCKIKLIGTDILKIKGSLDKWGIVGRSTTWEKTNLPKDEKQSIRQDKQSN